MNIHDMAQAIDALTVTLTDYGLDPATRDDVIERFVRRVIEQELSTALGGPKGGLHAENYEGLRRH